jgi:hypothetical protein
MHFNDEVMWTSGAGQEGLGFDFLRTAIHEAGHALGLEHSPHADAVMYFAVSGHTPDLRLSRDDVVGIQVRTEFSSWSVFTLYIVPYCNSKCMS